MAVNLTPLLSVVDFSSTTVAVLAVAAVLVAVFVVVCAALFVMGTVRGQVFYAGKWWETDVYETALADVKRQAMAGELVDAASRRALNHFEGRSGGSVPRRRVPRM